MASQVTTVYTYQLNGVTVDFKIPFDYLSRKFVKVTLLGKDRKELTFMTDYRFMSPTLIRTVKAWGSSDGYNYIEIRRETSARDLIVDFSDGSILRAGDLNTANLQAMHIAEEARSLAADSLGVDDFGNLDARFRKIVNLGDPVGRKDAVNKGYIDDAKDGVIQSRDKALQYRNEAQRFRNEAESFKNQTNTLKGQAETAKTGAESAKNTAVSKASEASSSATKASQAMASAQGSANNAVTSEKKAKASETAAAGSAKRAEDAAAKAVGGGLPTVGGTMTGPIVMGNSTDLIPIKFKRNGTEISLGKGLDDSLAVLGPSQSYDIRFPKKSGNLALKEDYVPKTGGTFEGLVTVAADGDVGGLKVAGKNIGAYGQLFISSSDSVLKMHHRVQGSSYWSTFPKKTGTLAIAEDYVPKTGGTFTGLVNHDATIQMKAGSYVQWTDKAKDNRIGIYRPADTAGALTYYRRGTYGNIDVIFPSKSGTLAIAGDYVPKTGGTFSNAVHFKAPDSSPAIRIGKTTTDSNYAEFLMSSADNKLKIKYKKDSGTADRWIEFPENAGTLALTSEKPRWRTLGSGNTHSKTSIPNGSFIRVTLDASGATFFTTGAIPSGGWSGSKISFASFGVSSYVTIRASGNSYVIECTPSGVINQVEVYY